MSLVVEWSPSEGGLLFVAPETGGLSPITLSATAEESAAASGADGEEPAPTPVAVTGYAYQVAPPVPPSVLSIVAGAAGVTLSSPSLAGLFPIEHIDVLLGGQRLRVSDWDEIPAGAEDIISFRPGTSPGTTFALSVTAVAGGQPIAQTWSFTITRDWTAGKLRLQEEVNARR